ncbi:class I SAM-dependent methyltransferase [Pedobacter fastidiosus]|uniref:Class I SAM-dependent methyltransferase n=1 Tax=Pedobacter fastidiosus TaxID=2765361 RepID=A0ABR7KZF5_9SPHI|nr:class I SAM-dependent methyltransferase [Pedobacter fastidiosus]MBC6113152.1 class I SAM-dependent methyltransferase [Pedobacter fastidiosus]
MGSQAIQGKLWGQRSKDWSEIQEQTGKAGYDFVLDYVSINSATKLLDVGCGSGYFCEMAFEKGADITGLDATTELIIEAKKRVPNAKFLVGEIEELPFEENSFDLVCGFNSFQYAANIKNALVESKRVLKNGGSLAVMIWGNKEDCEAASYLKAVGSLLPSPPPGSGGPFALSENQLLENTLEEVGLKIICNNDIASVWDYPNLDTALKGLLSAGPAAKAIETSGFEMVYETTLNAVKPYIQQNGRVVYHNKFRIVIAKK